MSTIKKKLDWSNLWIEKIDYIRDYYKNIVGKYSLIDESIDYYLCMAELANYYLKDYSNYYDYVYSQHDIMLDNNYVYKVDVGERSFSEYLKYMFYSDKYSIDDIYNFIEKSGYKYNYDLVVARLLFPNYYFYYFEKIILFNEDEKILVDIISKIDDYQVFINKIISKINKIYNKKIVLPF